jgi:hypothetical protein
MKLIPESISVYVWAGIGGGAFVVVILVFWCIYRSVKKALKKGMSVRESATLRMERNSTHLADVVLQQPQRSPTWSGKDKSWSGLGKDMKEATIVPLGLRGRGISVPAEEQSKHTRQERMVFADSPVPALTSC